MSVFELSKPTVCAARMLARHARLCPVIGLLAFTMLAGCNSEGSAAGQDTIQVVPGPVARCVNISNALEAPREGDWGYTVRRADLARIAAAGFDTVRLPVKWSAHAERAAPFRIDPGCLARVDEVVGWALADGLQVIVDVHHYDELFEAPDRHMPRLEAIWRQLARHYRDAPDGVILEILNEPRGALDLARVDRLNRRLLEVIREQDPDRWVVLATGNWGGLDGLLRSRPPGGPRLIASLHYYEPYAFTHQGAGWLETPPPLGRDWPRPGERAALVRHFEQAAVKARKEGLALLLGEFGANAAIPADQRAAWILDVRKAAERHAMGWCHWGFARNFGVYDPEAERWRPAILDALMGP